jgi:hypothetical protein
MTKFTTCEIRHLRLIFLLLEGSSFFGVERLLFPLSFAFEISLDKVGVTP